MNYKPVVLIIRDGWGENHNPNHDSFNAVKLAHTPIADTIKSKYPRTEIKACGLDVGLPDGVIGNSEVGHQNIGAGRIVDQELVRIDKGFTTNSVKNTETFINVVSNLKKTDGKLHLFGLLSDAGVHSVLRHLFSLLNIAKDSDIKKVFIHAFTDGRDCSPRSGINFIKEVEAKCNEIGVGKIATVCGRFWSMDRDLRWDRIQKAYDCLTGKEILNTAKSAVDAVQYYYDNPISKNQTGDEFVQPTNIIDSAGNPLALVEDGDTIIFFNFRGDRPRELTSAFIDEKFNGFDREKKLDVHYVTMTEYKKGLCPNVLFYKPAPMINILGKIVSDQGISQFRCAETEKYPHITFFFNDYREEPFAGEDRKLIPSPRDVATYDLKPEMSAPEICQSTVKAIKSGKYGLIVVNFANPDMVGHTGSLEATIKACEIVDNCVGQLVEATNDVEGAAVIIADHGNADQMWAPEIDGPHTSHTLNPVEVVVVGKDLQGISLKETGRLADIAPTILKLLGLEQPKEMTGDCLIK